jgi:Uma2 family endonuclease
MSTTVATKPLITPAELLEMPDWKNYELDDGVLVERSVSKLSSLVASRINRRLGSFCEDSNLAWVFGADLGYQCFPEHPNKVRKPDVSLILQERTGGVFEDEGFSSMAPDLAVEVVSPKDLAYEVQQKLQEYLAAGVRLVWIVYPHTQTVVVHRGDHSVSELGPNDELSGEDVIPGFVCWVKDFFPPITPESVVA